MAGSGADVYLDYMKSLLATEEARKTSFESRGVTVITTSGTLATLLFGLVAVVTGASTFVLPPRSHGYLVAAVIAFAVAVLLGIITNMPILYPEVNIDPQDITNMVTDGPITADVMVARSVRSILNGTRRANNIKSYFLLAATSAELTALVILTIAVCEIVAGGSQTTPAVHPVPPGFHHPFGPG